jgi:hypothetical protein
VPEETAAARACGNESRRTPLSGGFRIQARDATMGRYLLLWLIGVPIPILILIWLFGGLS